MASDKFWSKYGKSPSKQPYQASKPKRDKLDARWYAREEEPHDAIIAVATKLLKSGRRSQLLLWRDLYLDTARGDYGKYRVHRPGMRARFNVIRNACETMQARVGKNLPRPKIVTTAGGFKHQRKAKKMERFIEGEWERLRANAMRRAQVLDACIFGTGAIKVYDKHGRVCHERTWVGDLLTHPREEAVNHVRTLYQVACIDREVAAECWPDYRKEIENLGDPPSGVLSQENEDDDLVMIVEAWRLPSGEDDDGEPVGGRHAIVIDGCTLHDEEWTRHRFPFSFLHATHDPMRMWGIGFPERMAGAQSEQNAIAELVSDIARMMTPKYAVNGGAKISVETLSNEIEVWEVNGPPGSTVEVIHADAAILGTLQYALQQRQSVYQEQGIDTYAAESSKPADMTSGKAALVHQDINSERHIMFAQNVEDATVDLATLDIETCEEIVANGGGEKLIAHAGKGALEELKWDDVSLGKNPYVVRVDKVSALSHSVGGKLAQLQEMQNAGWVTPQEARELYDMPDLERSNDMAFARRDLSRQLIEAALDGESAEPRDGETIAATEVADLPYIVEAGTQQYALLRAQGASEDDLVMLLDLIGSAEAIMARKLAEAEAKAQAAMPPPMPPGGPVVPPVLPPPAVPDAPLIEPMGAPPGMLQ